MATPKNFADKDVIERLASKDQRTVAIALSDLLIDQEIRQNDAVGEALRKIRNQIWDVNGKSARSGNYESDTERNAERNKLIRGFIQEVPEADRQRLAEDYTRLGHLYEIAGHQARHNFMKERRVALSKHFKEHAGETPDKNLLSPGGVHELLFHGALKDEKDVGHVVQQLGVPVSEYVFTQHPTNTNTLESMRAQRDISRELNDLVRTYLEQDGGGYDHEILAKLKQYIEDFRNKPVVDKSNFTAKDETDIVVNFLANAYHDIKRAYHVTEQALSDKFGDAYDLQQRKDLDLKLRFGSWGSAGDKDGNKNIKSENTLEAVLIHRQKAAELISKEMASITSDTTPAYQNFQRALEDANDGYRVLIERMEAKRRGNDIALTNAEFDDISKQAQAISHTLDGLGGNKALVQVIDKVADLAHTPKQIEDVLMLKRRVSTFGLSLGKIEYRETAEEYGRVLATLFKDVKTGDELLGTDAGKYVSAYQTIREQRESDKPNADIIAAAEKKQQAALTSILSDESKKAAFIGLAKEKMAEIQGDSMRKYGAAEQPFDDAIVYHTLRRMELARDFDDMVTHNVLAECKGTVNLLEALAMQVAVTDDHGKRALMHVVPLFEEADTMAKIPSVIKDGLANAAYKEHVDALKARDGADEITQQIQIAHSDNARRAGSIASRGIIHEGHAAAKKARDEYNAAHPTEKLNLEFFEGGSLSDSYRNGVRAATAMVRDFDLGKQFKATFQGGDLLNYFSQSTSFERLATRGIVQQVELLRNGQTNGINKAREHKITEALAVLQKQYDANVYEAPGNPIGRLLYELGYRGHIADGNAGTRAGARNEELAKKEDAVRAIDATAIRTIGFSETLQHEGIHPTFVGAGKIRQAIEDELGQGRLSAQEWRSLYKESPAFRDAIDKLAYSIINSDLKQAGEKLYWRMGSKEIPADSALMGFVAQKLPEQYVEAGKLVFEALTGEPFLDATKNGNAQHLIDECQKGNQGGSGHMLDAADRIRHLIANIEPMKHFESLSYKHRFAEGVNQFKGAFNDVADDKKEHVGRLFHNAVDTLTHGRTFMADDPNYRAAYMAEQRQRGAVIA